MNIKFDVVRVGDKYQIEKTEGGKVFVMYRHGVPVRAAFHGDLGLSIAMLESNAEGAPMFLGTTWVSQATVYQGGHVYPNMFMAKTGASARVGTFARPHRIGAFNAL